LQVFLREMELLLVGSDLIAMRPNCDSRQGLSEKGNYPTLMKIRAALV
jgi:hypothetical protein